MVVEAVNEVMEAVYVEVEPVNDEVEVLYEEVELKMVYSSGCPCWSCMRIAQLASSIPFSEMDTHCTVHSYSGY